MCVKYTVQICDKINTKISKLFSVYVNYTNHRIKYMFLVIC
jgi:hypothetical protein